jgi:hypothetical protein
MAAMAAAVSTLTSLAPGKSLRRRYAFGILHWQGTVTKRLLDARRCAGESQMRQAAPGDGFKRAAQLRGHHTHLHAEVTFMITQMRSTVRDVQL